MVGVQPTDESGKKFLDIDSNGAALVRFSGDLDLGAVELKDATTDARAVVKSDGVNNALVVAMNSVPTHAVTQSGTWDIGTLTGITNTVTVSGSVNATCSATDLDIRDLDWASDDIKVYQADECQRILTADDAVTTINYASAAKASVSNIVTSSSGLGRKVTDTYDNSGATTLVISRAVANV